MNQINLFLCHKILFDFLSSWYQVFENPLKTKVKKLFSSINYFTDISSKKIYGDIYRTLNLSKIKKMEKIIVIWVFNGFSKTWYQNNWQSIYFWKKYIIKILGHYKRVKIDQKLQIWNFKNDFWAKFGIFTPFWGILYFSFLEFQNAKILIPRFWKSVKNWIF